MVVGYGYLDTLLENDSELRENIRSLLNSKIHLPKMIDDIFDLLDSQNLMSNTVSSDNKVSLLRLVNSYYNCFADTWFKQIDLESTVDKLKTVIYYTETFDGRRIATTGEIEEGIPELVAEPVYATDEYDYKMMLLLNWTFTGSWLMLKKAGYETSSEFNIFTRIQKCSEGLIELIEWGKDPNKVNNAIKMAKKVKKYKYPAYDPNEIKAEFSLKQVIYHLDSKIPRGSENKDYRRCIRLIIAYKKDPKMKFSTDEKILLRQTYDEVLRTGVEEVNVNKEVEELCNKVREAHYSHKIPKNHISMKIVGTLERFNYSRCTVKQKDVLVGTLEKIKSKEESEVAHQKAIEKPDPDSLLGMSDLLGSGNL